MAETRDIIRERMLNGLDNKYDKLTGSWTWETYQAESIENENLQLLIDNGTSQAFAGTADLEHLKVMAFEDRGIIYRDATFASGIVKVTGTVGAIVNIGDLFANQLNQYSATEKITLGSTGISEIKVQCTTAGSIGNTPIATIINFPKSLQGINTVTNELAFTNGYDEEGRDSLLERYYLAIRSAGNSGNVNHYTQWATSVEGVGLVKVKPTWNGGGTVKVIILDSNKALANQELITNTDTYIKTQMPIGVSLTTTTATELAININCKITLTKDYILNDVKITIQKNIETYFKDNAFLDNNIYYAKVGNVIFDTLGVNNIDYATFTLNGVKNDIALLDTNATTQIAKLGTLTITV